MRRLRKILSPIYRWVLAKLWNISILYPFLLRKSEAKQLQKSMRHSKILISEFRKNGNEIKVNLEKNIFNWAIKCPVPDGEIALTWGDHYFATEISNSLTRLGHNVRVDNRTHFNNSEIIHDEINLVIRGLEPFRPVKNAINVLWVISHPELVSVKELKSYDLVFAASKSWSVKMTTKSKRKVYPLLQATNPNNFNPYSAKADTKNEAIFVGNSRNKFRKIVKDAINAKIDFKIIGNNWENFVPLYLVESKFVENESLSEIYRTHRFVLNDHWPTMKKHGFISNRIFDAVASGARVISDSIYELDEIFGNSVKTYSNITDLMYLTNEKNLIQFGSRSEIDANAERIGHSESFDNRVNKIIEAIKELNC